MDKAQRRISIVVPTYNEAENVVPLTEAIAELFDNLEAVDNWSCTIGTNGYNEITKQALRAIGKKRLFREMRN